MTSVFSWQNSAYRYKEKTSSQGRALDTFHSHPHHVLSFSSTTFFIVSWYRHVLNIFSVLYWLIYKSPCHFLYIWDCMLLSTGFPGGSVVKNLPANAGDMGLIPGSGGSRMPWSNQVRAPQLLSWYSRTRTCNH